jgi:peptidoglycan/LPS O-acetylase OafA/YrhL
MLKGCSQSNWNFIATGGFYLNMLFSTLFIANIISYKQGRTDKFLGDLSYPLYLCHLPVGFVVINLFNLVPRTLTSLFVSLLFCVPATLALHLIDKKINLIRDVIRPKEKTSVMQSRQTI